MSFVLADFMVLDSIRAKATIALKTGRTVEASTFEPSLGLNCSIWFAEHAYLIVTVIVPPLDVVRHHRS
jgi:hypothetical protein